MQKKLAIALTAGILITLCACSSEVKSDKNEDGPIPVQAEQNKNDSENVTDMALNTQNNYENESTKTEEDQWSETILQETEYQLSPPQKQTSDAEFDTAYKEFVEAIHNRDLSTLDGFLDDEIKSSFGDEPGKDIFYEYWNLNNNPDQSELWIELEKIIELGGSYNSEEKTFTAPYTFKGVPDEFDGYSCLIVIDRDVNIYEKMDLNSEVIASLNYSIISFENLESGYGDLTEQDLTKIRLLSGQEGYIQKKYLRSPIDYRFMFKLADNQWKLAFLLAGD